MSAYAQHFDTVCARFSEALAASGYQAALIYAGQPRYAFLDDNAYPYRVNPLFKYWLPIIDCPHSAIYFRPGQQPRLYLYQARDYWHAQPEVPSGDWQQHVELVVISDAEQLRIAMRELASQTVLLGEAISGPLTELSFAAVNPPALLHYLHYQRGQKTAWEIANLRRANQLAVRSHRAAAAAYHAGASELAIQAAYLAAIDAREQDMPYNNIVALNEHGAVLHYDRYQAQAPADSRSFLIDAGAQYRGYCADITRTYTKHSGMFAELIQAMDEKQQQIIAAIRIGQSYQDLHRLQHQHTAELLHAFGLLRGSVESILANGYTRAFFPHGLGHFIGLQVHDVGGHLANPQGDSTERDASHPFLRLSRTIEANQVFTIEPGLYVIDQLLEDYAGHADFNWSAIAELRPYGGVRIEDSVVVLADGGVENLTRDAFAQDLQ